MPIQSVNGNINSVPKAVYRPTTVLNQFTCGQGSHSLAEEVSPTSYLYVTLQLLILNVPHFLLKFLILFFILFYFIDEISIPSNVLQATSLGGLHMKHENVRILVQAIHQPHNK